MAKWLVTGGAGFIGSHLIDALLGRGDSVVCVDSLNEAYDSKIKVVRARRHHEGWGDSGHYQHFVATLQEIEHRYYWSSILSDVDVVVHLAARAGVRASVECPELYHKDNGGGTLAILKATAKHAPAARFIYASSSSVYGDYDGPMAETLAVNPQSPYAATKLYGEALTSAYRKCHGLDATSLRFFTVYGPDGRPDMCVRIFAEAIMAGKPVPVFGDGLQSRAFTYVGDVVRGILTAAAKKDMLLDTYNLGNHTDWSLDAVIRRLEGYIDKEAKVEHCVPNPADVRRTWCCPGSFEVETDWRCHVGIDEGLKNVVDWMKQ